MTAVDEIEADQRSQAAAVAGATALTTASGPPSSSTAMAKQQLRCIMSRRLSALPQDSLTAQGLRVLDSLQGCKPYRDASRISIYLSMPTGELPTDAIVRHALASGKQVFVPFLSRSPPDMSDMPPRLMDMLRLEGVEDYENLRPDRWGIPSFDPAVAARRQPLLGPPRGDAPPRPSAALDLVLVPGLAFDLDADGSVRRLGHGKGFYDCFFSRYAAATAAHEMTPPFPLLVGLALAQQLLSPASGAQVPVEAHDRRLHRLVVGNGEIKGVSNAAACQADTRPAL